MLYNTCPLLTKSTKFIHFWSKDKQQRANIFDFKENNFAGKVIEDDKVSGSKCLQ